MDVEKFSEKVKNMLIKNPPENFGEYLEAAGVFLGLGAWAAGGASLASGGDSIADERLVDFSHVMKGLMWLLVPATTDDEDGSIFIHFGHGLFNLLVRKLKQNPTVQMESLVGTLAGLSSDMAANALLSQYATKEITEEQFNHVSRNLSEAFVAAMQAENTKLNPEVGLSN